MDCSVFIFSAKQSKKCFLGDLVWLDPEDEGTNIFWKIKSYLPNNSASDPRRPVS
jgi:hypothetical protein